MNRVRIKTILSGDNLGKEVTVNGWVRTRRESKGFAFVSLSDGSSLDGLQLIIPGESPASKEIHRCNTGSAIRATGVIKQSPGKGQQYEIEVSDIYVYGDADPGKYPLQKKGHSLEFLREIGHLRPRTNTFGAVFRVRNILADAVHEFFQSLGFIWVHTPIITSSDCEGAGDLFTVTGLDLSDLPKHGRSTINFNDDFFGKRAYLTVSGQLEAEFLAMSLGDVYAFGPTFRAENSNTSRHLSEFWMIEPEMAFSDLNDNMDLAEDFFHMLCRQTVEKAELEIAFFEKYYKQISLQELHNLAEKPFVRVTYSDAIKELRSANKKFEFPIEWGLDLQSEHERYLTDHVFRGPVIVIDYPKGIKAFYMRLNDDGKTVAAMDVLLPKIGEIIGGSQREERFDVLRERMLEAGVQEDDLHWYLDLRRFGSAPHAGFGLGFERLIQYMTGMQNIRDVIPCPRAPKTIRF
jgi:asparaginyl-tRNA synthetase